MPTTTLVIDPTVTAGVSLAQVVEEQCGEKVRDCYQCGKCSAGCPVVYAMDVAPHRVLRAAQLNQKAMLVQSSTIWVCASCHTCATRCPCEIDIPKVMDTFRRLAIAEKVRPAQPNALLFDRLFLKSVELTGRLYELGLVGFFNLLSKQPFASLDLAPAMMLKGKIPLLPSRLKGRREVSEIFRRVSEVEKKGNQGIR